MVKIIPDEPYETVVIDYGREEAKVEHDDVATVVEVNRVRVHVENARVAVFIDGKHRINVEID